MPGTEHQVTIHTWPFQWLYWPIYCALHDVEQRYSVRFILNVVSGNPSPTDKGIREQARNDWQKLSAGQHPDTVLALCEPDNTLPDARHIPLVSQLPHWLLARRAIGKQRPAENVRNVLAFPEGTTSGDFVREHYPNSIHDEPLDLQKYWDELESTLFASTFYPLHTLSAEEPSHGANPIDGIEQITGIRACQTALIFPARNRTAPSLTLEPRLGDQRTTLLQAVTHGVCEVLRTLEATQGRYSQVQSFILGRGAQFVAPQDHSGHWLTSNGRLGRLLAIYLQQGCYFTPQDILDKVPHKEERLKAIRDEVGECVTALQDKFVNPNHKLFASGEVTLLSPAPVLREHPAYDDIKISVGKLFDAVGQHCRFETDERNRLTKWLADKYPVLCCGKAFSRDTGVWLPLLCAIFNRRSTIPDQWLRYQVEGSGSAAGGIVEGLTELRGALEDNNRPDSCKLDSADWFLCVGMDTYALLMLTFEGTSEGYAEEKSKFFASISRQPANNQDLRRAIQKLQQHSVEVSSGCRENLYTVNLIFKVREMP